MQVISSERIPIFIWSDEVIEGALEQLINLSYLPFTFHHIAAMPDYHFGYGMPIGGVIACDNVVIPNAVGVDIGCGMCAVKTNLKYDKEKFSMSEVRACMAPTRSTIPVGEGHSRTNILEASDMIGKWMAWDRTLYKENVEKRIIKSAEKNLGTLGGGNHFIELQRDEDDCIWLMIHSGSRNIGHNIAKFYNDKAKELNKKWCSVRIDDLAFFPANIRIGQDYISDMQFALDYALVNRLEMMNFFKEAVITTFGNTEFEEVINIHHNYAALENHYGKNVWIHRKGATSAKEGELGIIPGSQGTSSYIVRGLGNAESFMSCSHGAGRPFSRTHASKTLTKEECDKAMEGIVCDRWSKVRRGRMKGQLDLSEAPGAYKDIDVVINNQLDLVEVVTKLTPIGVIKG